MDEPNPDDELDARIQGALAQFPPTPRMEPLVRARLRRRRRIRCASLGAVVGAFVAAGTFGWRHFSQPENPSVAILPIDANRGNSDGDPYLGDILFASPPVDSLETLALQQARYVSVLHQLESE